MKIKSLNLKKAFFLISFLHTLHTTAQNTAAPEKISYQVVVRNTSNNLVTNQVVGMQISILQGSATGTPVYVETQNPTSNINGLVTLQIGGGTLVSGAMAAIDWANGPYFIKTETDPTGGSNYTIMGTTQLLSVPYALYAKTSGSSSPGFPSGGTTGQVLAKVDATNYNTEWVEFKNLYNEDGILNSNRIINQQDKQLTFLSSATTGTNHLNMFNNTFSVDAVNKRIGLGTTAPQRTLQINGDGLRIDRSGSSASLYLNRLNPSTGSNLGGFGFLGSETLLSIGYTSDANNLSSDASSLHLLNNGNFGIGTILPSEKLHVQGNARIIGDVYTKSVILTSDKRLKKEINKIQNPFDSLKKLNGYTYYWMDKSNDTKLQYGVIAQEVEKVFPDMVYTSKEGFLAVNYQSLIPVLLEVVKDQQDDLSKNNDEIKQLKQEVEMLKKLVNSILKEKR